MATDIKANATTRLHDLGQSLWLDNITRGLLTSGTLRRYIDEWSVTGLTSNPTIFDHAIENSHFYDDAIRQKTGAGTVGEALFFELALEDLTEAAALFKPVHEATQGLDGWVSLEVSPLLASDTTSTIKEAADLHARAKLTNLLIKIPGTPEGVAAIEASIAAGVPVNVTLLFSQEQYLAAAHAYMRGIERRIAAGLDPRVGSIASVFISRWDKAVMDKVAPALRNTLGIAVAKRTYAAYRELLDSPQWRTLPQPARCRSVCCGPAPARKTRTPLMCSTSKPSPRRIRSTPYPTIRCAPSPITVASHKRCRLMVATRKRCSLSSQKPGWTWRRSVANSSARAPSRLTIHGTS